MNSLPLLTLITLTPVAGAFAVALIPNRFKRHARCVSLGFGIFALAQALVLYALFVPRGGMQFEETHRWIPHLGVEYHAGIDGLGLTMVILTALLVPFAMLAIWHREMPRGYHGLFLLLQAGVFGVFTALNFFHWFIYWELSLIPAFFLIKLWGGTRRGYAATQFFIYTLAGSVAMLLAFQVIFLGTGLFDFIQLAELGRSGELPGKLASGLGWAAGSADTAAQMVFWGVFLGLAVKVPLMPFHIWLPAAYAEAPTGVSMVLTGLMSKMGVYGFLRILLPLFPQQMRGALDLLMLMAIVTILFSAWSAFVQKDLKRTIAYSSMNHLGYCLLGVFATLRMTGANSGTANEQAAALDGVILQMFNHGLSASALFCFVGWMEDRSGGLRGLNDFGGLRKPAPVFCGLMGIAVFSSLGLPGLNGFVGEFLIFKGAFALTGWQAGVSALGLLLTAIFLLNVLQRVFHGPVNTQWIAFPDLTRMERFTMAPIIVLMFVVGIYPQLLLRFINPSVMEMVLNIPK
jgi:NADH-quinone oxidoreductase subunit M